MSRITIETAIITINRPVLVVLHIIANPIYASPYLFIMVNEKWELKFMFRKRITNLEELSEFLAKEFPHEEVIMLIFDKLHLLREDPKKYAKEKLKNQTDKDGRPLFSIEVTGDIRIVYSFEPKNCTVFIWRIGRHKKAYRF